MYAVNLGTRGVQEAIDVLEYANIRSGTKLSDQRIAMARRNRTTSASGTVTLPAVSWTAISLR